MQNWLLANTIMIHTTCVSKYKQCYRYNKILTLRAVVEYGEEVDHYGACIEDGEEPQTWLQRITL